MINYSQFQACFPHASRSNVATYYPILTEVMKKYSIKSDEQIAMFLAQLEVESGSLHYTSENLNYSAKGLRRVFSKYFTPAQANQYARNPRAIANRVYGNRMGNGPESSGDGWRYRGAGLIQLTGKENHEKFAKSIKMSLDEASEWMRTPEGAAEVAGWYWDSRKLNVPAAKGDVKTVTKLINGGYNHLAERTAAYNRNIRVLK